MGRTLVSCRQKRYSEF